jgi:hypothetical protein
MVRILVLLSLVGMALDLNFNNNSAIGEDGSSVVDVSSFGNNGSVYNSFWSSDGRFGGCMHFNGSGYVSVPSSGSLLLGSGPATVSLWVRAGSEVDSYLLEKYGAGYPYPLYGLAFISGRVYGYFIDCGTGSCSFGSSRHYVSDGKRISDGGWHYIVLTRDNGNVSLFVDRELVSSILEGPWDTDSGADLLVGNGFVGDIDEVRIYRRAFSLDEINLQYLSEFQKYNSTEWRFYDKVKDLPGGTYSYYAQAVDSGGNVSTEVRSLTINKTVAVGFSVPTKEDNYVALDSWAVINVSLNESDLKSFKLFWNGSSYMVYDGSLVLGYNFNNNSFIGEDSSRVVDLSKYGNDGVSYANLSSDGLFGGCVHFNGNNYVSVRSSPSLLLGSGPATISLWARTITESDGYILEKYGASYPYPLYGVSFISGRVYGYFIDCATGGCGFGSSRHYVSDRKRISDGLWHQIVLVRDGGNVSLYVDRELVSSISEGPWNTDSGSDLLVGNGFVGDVDKLRVYSRALSSAEINLQYLSEFQKYGVGNVTEWRFIDRVKDVSNGNYSYYGLAEDLAGNPGLTDNGEAYFGQ